ncbi:SRPBCC family protein [Catenuloplanes atrovinosus]|uniref:Uncharacterized protein YndB with AHSA1/START domain n=1 Tax=Catenuloplanes atrovinosus TaxID=137266 RepID=A0AAE3YP67_9ACTN|nr:SRPBCC family protein [Catenuloplanes atrovinosus]MDR7276100.1 uncharacterized protein YndB with AHSA1/START domain [Catenuloplanes atrovinosus]
MTNPPSGRLSATPDGTDLILTRTFRAPVEDVWASITEPERTARWYGTWTGEAAPGATIKVQLGYEQGAPWTDMRIEACEPYRRLGLSAVDEHGSWHLELFLSTRDDGVTELRFVHHLPSPDGVGEMGPGWEYYLDMLAASRSGDPLPAFDDYYPSMKPYYEALR